jgi:hypothetical protein
MSSKDTFDALLSAALVPPLRPADRMFVARVQAAVFSAERARRWRRRALQQIGSEALVLLALAGAGITLAQVPAIGGTLAGVPFAAPAAVGALFLGWLALAQQRGASALG